LICIKNPRKTGVKIFGSCIDKKPGICEIDLVQNEQPTGRNPATRKRTDMKTKVNLALLPTFPSGLAVQDFNRPKWSEYVGRSGGFMAQSRDGQFEAIAEPLAGRWQFWLVRITDGEMIQEMLCAS
jgi:hypothetical protein